MHNEVLQVALLAWLLAQLLKAAIASYRDGYFSWERLLGSGGMPSSHSAFVVALSTAVGMKEGWTSPLTAVTIVFSLIIMYDAAGVRRAAGEQAKVLNEIMNEITTSQSLRGERLKELIGHTPFEVIAGAVLGVALAVWRLS